jgi:hypothetical protein
MDVITRHFSKPPYTGEPKDFIVYTKEEADREGIRYVENWRTANRGDWILTDDDYVMQVIYVIPFDDRASLIFTVGKRIVNTNPRKGIRNSKAKRPLLFEEYRDYPGGADFTEARVMSRNDRRVRETKTKLAIELFVQLWLTRGGKLHKDDYYKIGKMYAPSDRRPDLKGDWLLKVPEIRREVMKRLAEEITQAKMSFGTVLATTDSAKRVAIEEGQSATLLKIAEFELNLLRVSFPGYDGPEHMLIGDGDYTDVEIIDAHELPAESASQKRIREEMEEARVKTKAKKAK